MYFIYNRGKIPRKSVMYPVMDLGGNEASLHCKDFQVLSAMKMEKLSMLHQNRAFVMVVNDILKRIPKHTENGLLIMHLIAQLTIQVNLEKEIFIMYFLHVYLYWNIFSYR